MGELNSTRCKGDTKCNTKEREEDRRERRRDEGMRERRERMRGRREREIGSGRRVGIERTRDRERNRR